MKWFLVSSYSFEHGALIFELSIMQKTAKIYVAGHRGLVGSAILKNLKEKGYLNLITRTSTELDLRDMAAVEVFFKQEKPEYVFLAAAKVGGIIANNTYRADFLYENLQIQNNVIHQSYKYGVRKLLFLGSTCIYPKMAPQPMPEESLLTAPLEYTNEPYAIAKIAGIKLCESYNIQYGTNFLSVMPTNLFGPNDNFDLEKSHVLPALMRKIHLGKALGENNWAVIKKDFNQRPVEGVNGNANQIEIGKVLKKYGIQKEEIEIWGSGTPKREFLWSEDMADACVYIMQQVDFKNLIGSSHTQSKRSAEGLNLEPHPVENEKRQDYGEEEIRNTHINIGTGKDISIKDLAILIKEHIGFQGELVFNTNKPDGTPRKLTEVSKLHALGWYHQIELKKGIQQLYKWYNA